MNSSPATSTQASLKFTAAERIWLANFPDNLLERLSNEEAAMLTRKEEDEWPEELRRKVAPFMDLDCILPQGVVLLRRLKEKWLETHAEEDEPPLTDEDLGWIYTEPQENWPEGLAEKVESLLNQEVESPTATEPQTHKSTSFPARVDIDGPAAPESAS